jgi:hypothetical protein
MKIPAYEQAEIVKRLDADTRLKRLVQEATERCGHELGLDDVVDIQNRFEQRSLIMINQ